MTPLPDKPVVVIFSDEGKISMATNISPDTMVIICHDKDSFDEYAKGKPFCNPAASQV